MNDAKREPKNPLIPWLTCLMGISFVLACITGGDGAVGEVHDWWSARGPVVPHDTFPGDCALCHVGDDWHTLADDFSFDHEARTGVALEGAHAAAQCLRCHNDRGPVELFARRGCAGCHDDVHRGKLGTTCDVCHDQRDWRPNEMIAIHSRTRFPLEGAHAAVACWRCHPGADAGNFAPVDVSCATCHAADLARAVPDHRSFSNACEDCHRTTTWTSAGFVHRTFPLTGAHAMADCAECHVGGVFSPVGSNCIDCHLTDYQAATNPVHTPASFPTACDQCHSTVMWSGATFDHAFPITGGRHGGFDCAECHVVPGSFAIFSCTDCHSHRQSEMDDEHDDVSGYVWLSSACYDCHPDGNE
ncbi:MAG: hypothetical protein WD226_01340 [Planctomycetota bacterium]